MSGTALHDRRPVRCGVRAAFSVKYTMLSAKTVARTICRRGTRRGTAMTMRLAETINVFKTPRWLTGASLVQASNLRRFNNRLSKAIGDAAKTEPHCCRDRVTRQRNFFPQIGEMRKRAKRRSELRKRCSRYCAQGPSKDNEHTFESRRPQRIALRHLRTIAPRNEAGSYFHRSCDENLCISCLARNLLHLLTPKHRFYPAGLPGPIS
jgi:hypothetical protein